MIVSKNRIVFLTKDQNGIITGSWQRVRREELTWQGAHPNEKGGFETDI